MGHAFQVTVELQQEGERVQGTLRGTQILTTCQFEGMVSIQGVVRWTQTGCSQHCAQFAHAKLSCPTLRVCAQNHSFDGLASSSTLEGAHHVSWETFDAATGAAAGVVTIDGTLQVRR